MFGEKSDPSETFSFTTGSAAAGTWTDGEARLYQDNTNGSSDAFTIIVSGDGFTADDMKPGGHWDQVSVRAIESLFTNVEPYKTYRPYLRIWRVAAISNESGISTNRAARKRLAHIKKTPNSAQCTTISLLPHGVACMMIPIPDNQAKHWTMLGTLSGPSPA